MRCWKVRGRVLELQHLKNTLKIEENAKKTSKKSTEGLKLDVDQPSSELCFVFVTHSQFQTRTDALPS